MAGQEVTVCRIRPVSWKISVQGEEDAEYVRQILQAMGDGCSPSCPEPDLLEPPVFSFVMTSKGKTPLTAQELQALFEHDEHIEMAWEE